MTGRMDLLSNDIGLLRAALESLPSTIADEIVGLALLASARVVRDEARANAPVKTGYYQQTIIANRARTKGRGSFIRGPSTRELSRNARTGLLGAYVTAGRLAYILEYGHEGAAPGPRTPAPDPGLAVHPWPAVAGVHPRGQPRIPESRAATCIRAGIQ